MQKEVRLLGKHEREQMRSNVQEDEYDLARGEEYPTKTKMCLRASGLWPDVYGKFTCAVKMQGQVFTGEVSMANDLADVLVNAWWSSSRRLKRSRN